MEDYAMPKDVELKPYKRQIRLYEADPKTSFIHHYYYVTWMEEARLDMMEQVGLRYYKQIKGMEIISTVLSISIEFQSRVKLDDTVVIETKMTQYDGTKMEVEYRMTDQKTGELRAIAKSTHCFINYAGKPISLKRSNTEPDA